MICVPPSGTHIFVVICVSLPGGILIVGYRDSDMFFPNGETHISFLFLLEGEKKTLKEDRSVKCSSRAPRHSNKNVTRREVLFATMKEKQEL